jgi:uncharacterized GH25 family protein
MRTQLPLLALGVLSTFACNLASAHGLWTEQRRGHIEVIYGHGAEDDAYKPQKVSRAWAFDLRAKMIPVTVEPLTDHARLEPIHPPAVVAVAFDNGMWSQTADKKWVNQGRSKVPGAMSSTHTFKYSLAFYHEGAKVPALDTLKLVIVPQTDPLLVGPGNPLPVKVLLNGKPAAGLKLIGDYRSAPDVVSAETDSQGLARIIVRNEGLNVIATQATVPVANDADVTEEGLFTSLTFVGKPHHD